MARHTRKFAVPVQVYFYHLPGSSANIFSPDNGSDSSLTVDGTNSRATKKPRKSTKEVEVEIVSENVDQIIASMSDMRQDTMKIAKEMERANELEETKIKLEETKIKMEIARQLGDTETLQKILQGLGE